MGILALGVGLGGGAVFGAMFHAVNHSITKAMLFLVAGNILAVMHTKSTTEIRGLSRLMPLTSALWLAGFLAITGSPPFGTFLSEFTILKAAIEHGHIFVAVSYLLFLCIIFVAMASIVLKMCHGQPSSPNPAKALREPWLMILPPVVFCAIALTLGVYMPPFLEQLLQSAAHQLGGLL